MKTIYLDNNATTLIAPEVQQAVLETLALGPLNPSSAHSLGRRGKEIIYDAKQTICRSLGVKAEEIFFTSGATESLNFLLKGFESGAKQVLTSDAEHAATVEILSYLNKPLVVVPVQRSGAPRLQDLEKALQEHAIGLIMLSAVYTETGAKLDLAQTAELALRYKVPFFLDAVGILGKEPFTIPPGVTAAVISGHKFHGPQGIGAVFLRSQQKISPLIHGGGQQKKLRSGTENLAGIVGLAKAFELLNECLPAASLSMQTLRDRFEAKLSHIASINGTGPRICNTSNLHFPGIDGETLLILLDQMGIIASLGSACASGSLSPSRVLQNMGLSYQEAKSSLRFSLSRYTTCEEIDTAALAIETIVQQCSKGI